MALLKAKFGLTFILDTDAAHEIPFIVSKETEKFADIGFIRIAGI